MTVWTEDILDESQYLDALRDFKDYRKEYIGVWVSFPIPEARDNIPYKKEVVDFSMFIKDK